MAGYIAELHRRNVFRAAGAFLVGGWLLLQVATALEEAMDLPVWFDTVVAAALLIALPVVLVISWVYELTPEGLQKTTDIDAGQSIAPKTGKRLDVITLLGVVVVIGLIGFDRFGPSPRKAEEASVSDPAAEVQSPTAATPPAVTGSMAALEKSIAVLPFVAMSESKDDEFFADGLSEELLNVLANIQGLKVAGRTSSFYYKNKNEDLRAIAGALGVAHILEGSVRRSGETLRVTAQLIQADDGFHLWSETFDRSDGDTFAIQDEIASNVAQALRAELIGATSSKITSNRNIEAQNFYLVAQAAMAQRTMADLKRARDLFAQARALSPETPSYAAGYAHAVTLLYWNHRAITEDEAIREATGAINQALEADTPSADTLAIAGLVEELRVLTARDPDAKNRALSYYQQALDKDLGNVYALQWLASIYLDLNDNRQSEIYFQKVIELDPLNILALTGLAGAQVRLGETATARRNLYKVQALFPDSHQAPRYISQLEFGQGNLARSAYWNQRAANIDSSPVEYFTMIQGYLMLGETTLAMEQVEKLHDARSDLDMAGLITARINEDYAQVVVEADRIFVQTGGTVFAGISALAHTMLGQYEDAIRILERQYPSLKGENSEYLDDSDMGPAVLLVYGYQQLGDAQTADRLANLLLSSEHLSEPGLDAIPFNRLTLAELLTIKGDTTGALAELKKLSAMGLNYGWNDLAIPIAENPVLKSLIEEPQFAQFIAREKQAIAEQAEMLRSGATALEVKADVEKAGFTLSPAG
ncbi:MAG: hypothetical protein AB8B96_18380 [Lysobacterales bacterium]